MPSMVRIDIIRQQNFEALKIKDDRSVDFPANIIALSIVKMKIPTWFLTGEMTPWSRQSMLSSRETDPRLSRNENKKQKAS